MSQRIIEAFHEVAQKHRLNYLIIGGYAASFWGTPRFTADLDYVAAENQFETVKQVMAELGFKLVFTHPKGSFAHFKSEASDIQRIDFMIVNQDTWAKLAAQEQQGDFGGKEPFPVVSPLHLISMKLHSASQPDRVEYRKDLGDIAAVMRVQNISYEMLEQEGILAKYGKGNILKNLKEELER